MGSEVKRHAGAFAPAAGECCSSGDSEQSRVASSPREGRLYICPTPLGNLGDITLRTLDALRDADTVCAEDTRVTGKLLAHFDIKKRLERLDENTIRQRAEAVADRIVAGERIAFCSDAGMPGVSDPGMRLVEAARAKGCAVDVLPGPTAFATAYVASGCADTSFFFGGFFPRKDSQRRDVLATLRNLQAALIFYESPNRLSSALALIASEVPDRYVTVCRELTKLHEEIYRGLAPQVAAEFARRDETHSIRGEIAIVIDGPNDVERENQAEAVQASASERALQLALAGERGKQISKMLVSEFGIAKNEAYDMALAAVDQARSQS